MRGFDSIFNSRKTEDILENAAVLLCSKYIATNDTVCYGAVHEMGDIIVPVLAQSILDPDYFCSQFLGYCSKDNYY